MGRQLHPYPARTLVACVYLPLHPVPLRFDQFAGWFANAAVATATAVCVVPSFVYEHHLECLAAFISKSRRWKCTKLLEMCTYFPLNTLHCFSHQVLKGIQTCEATKWTMKPVQKTSVLTQERAACNFNRNCIMISSSSHTFVLKKWRYMEMVLMLSSFRNPQ